MQPYRRRPPSPEALQAALRVYQEEVDVLLASLTEAERELLRTDEKLRLDFNEGMLPEEMPDVLGDAVRWAYEHESLADLADEWARKNTERASHHRALAGKYRRLTLPMLQRTGAMDFGDVAAHVSPGREKVAVPEPTLLPEAYQRKIPERIEANKIAIADAWRDGVEVEGAYKSNPEPYVVITPSGKRRP